MQRFETVEADSLVQDKTWGERFPFPIASGRKDHFYDHGSNLVGGRRQTSDNKRRFPMKYRAGSRRKMPSKIVHAADRTGTAV